MYTYGIPVLLTAFSGSPMNTLREGSSRNCLQSGHRFGGWGWGGKGGSINGNLCGVQDTYNSTGKLFNN